MVDQSVETFGEILTAYSEWAMEVTEPTLEDVSGFSNVIIDNLKKAVNDEKEHYVNIIGRDSGREINISFKGYGDFCNFDVFGNSYTFSSDEIENMESVNVEYESEHYEPGATWARVYIVTSEGSYLAKNVLVACLKTADKNIQD